MLFLAILASKCRWTGTNYAHTEHELVHHFQVSETRYIVTMPAQLQTVQAAARALKSEVEIILFSDLLNLPPLTETGHDKDYRNLHDLLGDANHEKLHEYLTDISPSDIAALMSTSGTTGLPKMAARTHEAMMLETEAIEDNNAAKPYNVRRLFCTPIFHAFSAPEMIINPLRLGYPTYIMRRYDDSFAQKVYDYGITETAAAPPMLMKLLQQNEKHGLLQSLRLVFSGGAPLAAELRKRVLDIFLAPPRIVQVYGMTEGGWFTTFKYPENDDTGSVGKVIPNYQVKQSSEGSIELPDGRKAGELMIKGPQLMTGYLGNAEASKDVFIEGWLKTGDIGYINDDGKVYLVDRAKDLIKVNGFQVAPAELEAALLQSQQIQDAAAMSVGHGVDEHPMVFVVAQLGTTPCTITDVQTHMRSRLARYKVASIEVAYVENIPRNPSGKILRKALKAQAVKDGLIVQEEGME